MLSRYAYLKENDRIVVNGGQLEVRVVEVSRHKVVLMTRHKVKEIARHSGAFIGMDVSIYYCNTREHRDTRARVLFRFPDAHETCYVERNGMRKFILPPADDVIYKNN